MDKRLKEIVIYILENSSALEPEQRAELEELRERLDLSALPEAEIERSLRRLLSQESGTGTAAALAGEGDFEAGAVELDPAALDYLERLKHLALISIDQEDELLARAARLHPDGIKLEQIQFLAAAVIFDENLGTGFGVGRRGDSSRARHQH